MTADSIPPAPPAVTSLRRLAALGLVAGGLSGFYLLTGLGVPCPFRTVTGWLCPFCGGTRAGAALLTGDLAGAWAANPLLLIAATLVGVRMLGWIAELIREPRATCSPRWVPWALTRRWGWWAGAIGVAYVVIRNLV